MFSNEPRTHYQKNQLGEVICQLRFPEILSIGAKPPVDFQEAIRADYPRYQCLQEQAAPKITGTPGNLSLQNRPATPNYQFVSLDGVWRVNLTSKFISLACKQYDCWEDFARHLDKPLAAFIQLYKPAGFDRVGLRYVNLFDRDALGLHGVPYRELFQSFYLGPLALDEISEAGVRACGVDGELSIRGGCFLKFHAGPGMVRQNGQKDGKPRFILDMDLYMPGNVPANLSAGALQTLHSQADALFRGAITDTLHDSLLPEDI
ncbi:MAG: TIGR04255 family protein [Firmicutes bacterium]|nr:TIGR04255 family protein [Bacillota bacterium]